MAINQDSIYAYLVADTELMTLINSESIAWSVAPEEIKMSIVCKMMTDPKIEGTERSWQRWRFTIKADSKLLCKSIADRLLDLLHNVKGDIGGCNISNSFNLSNEDPSYNEERRYEIQQDYRISKYK